MTENEVIQNRYQVVSTLGSGGMATVYRVFDRQTEREVALKILIPTHDLEVYESRLQREFLTLSKIRHPNIVEVFDYGYSEDGLPFFTMKLIRGQHPDHQWVKENYARFIKIVVRLLRTLHFIHSKGFVHGDIKPQNLIIPENEDNVIITDFGMVEEFSLTTNRPIQGTLSYMAPEVIRKMGIDQRSDIYSLGIFLYEMVSGTLPFLAAEPLTLLRQHLQKPPEPLQLDQRVFPAYLSPIIMRCIEKRPLDRYQSADDLLKIIARHEPGIVDEDEFVLRESYVLNAEFVGRRKEMEFLRRQLELALGGKGQTVFIAGEAGIGKTRMVEEFRLDCQIKGYSVLQATCQENDSRPHQTMVTLCRQIVQNATPKLQVVLEKYASELVKLSSDLAVTGASTAAGEAMEEVDPGVERTRFYDAITQLFIDLSRITPLIIIIEDLHWMDQVSMGILQYLIRNLGHANIMIVCTYLNEFLYSSTLWDDRQLIEGMLEENAENSNFHEIVLEPLKPGDVASMIGSILGMAFKPEDFGRLLHQETGGNPFIISEIMRELVKEKVIFREKGEWIIDVEDLSMLHIPAGVRDIYRKRLELLSPAALQLLDYLSIPQKPLEFKLLAKFTTWDESPLFEALYELLDMELIDQWGDAFGFAKPLVREMVYAAITPHLKIQLHATFADLLEKYSYSIEEVVNELAYHYMKGNVTEKALHYSVRAAEISERVYAHEQASEHYERALNLAERNEVELRSRLLRKIIDLKMITGNYGNALDRIREMFQLASEHHLLSVSDTCALNRKMAGIYQKMGEYHRALKYLYDALALNEEGGDSFVTAQIHTNLGNIYMFLGDFEKALAHCHTALEIVEPLGELRELSEIYNTYGKIYSRKRELEKALNYLKKSLQLRERIGDALGIGRTYSNLGVISNDLGNSQEAEDYLKSGLKIFEKNGFLYGCATIYNNIGILYHQRKTDWEKAITYLTKARELHERTGNDFGVAMTSMNLGLIFKDLGLRKRARHNFKKSIAIYVKLQNMSMVNQLHLLFASLKLDEGITKGVAEKLANCRSYIDTTPGEEGQAVQIWLEYCRYHLLRDELDQARECCHRAVLNAKKIMDRESEGYLRWLESEIYRRLNDTRMQEKTLLRSIQLLESEGSVLLLAKSHWSLGQLYHELNKTRIAFEYVEKARDAFQKLGVTDLYEQAQDLLAGMREKILPDLFKLRGGEGDLTTLYRISHDITSTLELPVLLEKILDTAIKTVHAERGLLILYDDIKQSYEVKTARNMDRKTRDDRATVSGGVVDRTVKQGIPILSSDAGLDPRFKENKSVILFNIKSILCVPLKLKEKVIGALYLDNRALTDEFTEKDLDFLVVLANQAAISIDNALLYERYRSAMEHLNLGIIVLEKNGYILECNNKASEIIGIMPDSVVGSKFGTEECPLDPAIGQLLMHTFNTGELVEREVSLETADGDELIIDLSTSLIYDGFVEVIGVMGIFRDITAFKQMQKELELQKRMNAIGDLAAKISHRMKSYLSGVKILAQEFKKSTTDELKSEYIDEILLEVAESERYVLNELSPGSGDKEQIKAVDLNSMIVEILTINEKELSLQGITTASDLDETIPPLEVDALQLKEVLNNLIINAMQAMKDSEEKHLIIQTFLSPDNVVLNVKDSGCGIPEHIREKIFEPFFTTREGGSGVGLWLAHNVVHSAGGKINVRSMLGKGTQFSLTFPHTKEKSRTI